MFLTEDEAKDKFCCSQTVGYRCIGSQCMAWRWEWSSKAYKSRQDFLKEHPLVTDDVEYRGFCGLAGRPTQ